MTIDHCEVLVSGSELPEEELTQYVARGREQYGEQLTKLDVKADDEFVDLSYHLCEVPFQRIRRITGYLVGTLGRFNNAKRCEESDRVKHGL